MQFNEVLANVFCVGTLLEHFSYLIPSGYVNRGRARLYTYLLLFLLIRSRSAKKKAETEALKTQSKEQIIATALRCSARS